MGLIWDALTHSEKGDSRGDRVLSALGALGVAAALFAVGWWLLDGFSSGVQDMADLDTPGRVRRRHNPIGMLGLLGFAAMGLSGLLALLGIVLALTVVLPQRRS